MAEWTPEAQDYLDGYLRQVSALARGQGDDASDIVDGLREHITTEVEEASGSLATLDVVHRVLSAVGTPDQVVSPDFSLSAVAERVKQTPPSVPVRSAAPRRRSGCAILAILSLGVAALVVIAIPALIFLFRYASYQTSEVVPATPVQIDPKTGLPVEVTRTMLAIAAAEQEFRRSAHVDSDGDGTPDYGTLESLVEEMPLTFEIDSRGTLVVHGYRFRVDVTPSGEPHGPAFRCLVTPPMEDMGVKRWAQIDETGELRMIDPPLAAEESEVGNG